MEKIWTEAWPEKEEVMFLFNIKGTAMPALSELKTAKKK